jgi:hypothetical protein
MVTFFRYDESPVNGAEMQQAGEITGLLAD